MIGNLVRNLLSKHEMSKKGFDSFYDNELLSDLEDLHKNYPNQIRLETIQHHHYNFISLSYHEVDNPNEVLRFLYVETNQALRLLQVEKD